MNDDLVKKMIEMKYRYFGSNFISVKNWIMFSEIKLPEGMTAKDIEGWAVEKQAYQAASKVELDGIKSSYEAMIVDRLDAAAALQDKILRLLVNVENSKDAKDIALTMNKIAEMQDEAMRILKVDAYRSNLYEKNKTATENLLKDSMYKIPTVE